HLVGPAGAGLGDLRVDGAAEPGRGHRLRQVRLERRAHGLVAAAARPEGGAGLGLLLVLSGVGALEDGNHGGHCHLRGRLPGRDSGAGPRERPAGPAQPATDASLVPWGMLDGPLRLSIIQPGNPAGALAGVASPGEVLVELLSARLSPARCLAAV